MKPCEDCHHLPSGRDTPGGGRCYCRCHDVADAAPALLAALDDCDRAFAAWQCGQIPGRPEDILALVQKVRAAVAQARG